MQQMVCTNMQPPELNVGLKEDLTKEKVVWCHLSYEDE